MIVVAVPGVGGSARFDASPASAFMNEGVAGKTTLFVSAELRPQVLQAVTEEALDPPDDECESPFGRK